MSEIIDVITRLSYELSGDNNLSKVIADFKQQSVAIDNLKSKLVDLKKSFDTSDNSRQQKQLQDAIDRTTSSIDKRTSALTKSFTENKKLQEAIQDEIGLLGGINRAISENEALRSKAATADIDFYNKEIEALKIYRKELLAAGTERKAFSDAKQIAQGQARADAINLATGKAQNADVIQIAKGASRAGAIDEANVKQIAIGESKAAALNEQLAIESGYIGRINKQIKDLEVARLKATQSAVGGINQEIAALEKERGVALGVQNNGSVLGSLFGISGGGGGLGRQLLTGSLIGLGIGSGIGLITRAISGLIEEVDTLGQSIFKTDKYQEDFKKHSEELNAEIAKEIEHFEALSEATNKTFGIAATDELDRYIEHLKAIGVVNGEIGKSQQDILDAETQRNRAKQAQAQGELIDAKAIKEALTQAKGSVDSAGNAANTPIGAKALDFFSGEKGAAEGAKSALSNFERISQIFDKFPSQKVALDAILVDIKKSGESNFLNSGLGDIIGKYVKDPIPILNAQKKLDDATQKLGDDPLAAENKKKEAEFQIRKGLDRQSLDEDSKISLERIKISENYVEQDRSIRGRYAVQLREELRHISQQQEDESKKLNGLSIETIESYERLRGEKIRESRQHEANELIEFHVKQIVSEREANEGILKAQAAASQNEIARQQKAGEDTFGTRQELLQQQAQIEANEINKKYFAEIAANNKLNVDTSKLEKERQEELLLSANKFNAQQIDLLTAYYNDRLNNIKLFEDNEAAIITGDASEQKIRAAQRYEDGLESLRKYHKDVQRENYEAAQQQKEQNLLNATLELQLAKERRDAIINNVNSSNAAKRQAETDVRISTNKLDVATEANTNKGTFRSGFAQFITNGEINNPALTQQQQLQLEVNKTAETYKTLSETVVQTFNTILARQQAALDQEIQVRTERVNIALKLAERGNTDALAIEEDRLKQAERQRAQSAKRQAAINAGLVVSNSLVAVAEAAAEGGGIGSIATIIAIVAALGAGFAAVESLSAKNNPTGFFKGGYTGDGNTHDIAGPVHKGEFVMPAHITQNPNNRAMLEAMYNHSFDPALMTAAYSNQSGRAANMGETNKHLVNITDRLDNLEFRAENKMDGNGLHQLIERHSAQERRRWK